MDVNGAAGGRQGFNREDLALALQRATSELKAFEATVSHFKTAYARAIAEGRDPGPVLMEFRHAQVPQMLVRAYDHVRGYLSSGPDEPHVESFLARLTELAPAETADLGFDDLMALCKSLLHHMAPLVAVLQGPGDGQP